MSNDFDLENEIGLIVRKYNDLNTATAASNEFVGGFNKALDLVLSEAKRRSIKEDYVGASMVYMENLEQIISKLKEGA